MMRTRATQLQVATSTWKMPPEETLKSAVMTLGTSRISDRRILTRLVPLASTQN